MDNWKEYIEYFVKRLISSDIMSFIIEKYFSILFVETSNEDINKNKKQWLLDEISKSNDDINRFKKIFYYVVVIANPEYKIEYLLEFLKVNQSIEDFKMLALFPLSSSWTGSEIPLINEKINFLIELKGNLDGFGYIDHKFYLSNYIKQLEEYKERVEKREYLEEM